MVTENPLYAGLGADPAARQRRWREFLLAGDPREEAVRRGDWAVGDGAFRQRLHQLHGRPAPRGRGRPRKAAASGADFPPKG